jgi:hypothetical protein
VRGGAGEGVAEGGVGVVPFAVTGRETSMGLHGGVQDATEKRSRGAEEGVITNSAVDGDTEGCGNEGRRRARIVKVYPGPVDSASGVVGESPVNLSIHEPAKGGEAGGAT